MYSNQGWRIQSDRHNMSITSRPSEHTYENTQSGIGNLCFTVYQLSPPATGFPPNAEVDVSRFMLWRDDTKRRIYARDSSLSKLWDHQNESHPKLVSKVSSSSPRTAS